MQPQFKDFEIGYNTTLGGEMLRHEAQQTKVQTRAASQRRVSTLRQEAVRNHTDPVAHLNSLTEAEQEVRTMAGWDGLSDEATEQAVVRQYDTVQSDIILQMAEQDPLAAQSRYKNLRDGLQEETRQNLERIITPAVKIANAEVKAGELFAGLHADGSSDPVEGVTDFLIRSVEKNASFLTNASSDDTLTGSAGEDSLEAPEQPQEQSKPEPADLQGPTLERARQLEEVGDLLRRRGDALADRMNHAGVMLSPGNLVFAQAMGAPLTIAFNEADPSLPAAEVLAQTMGWTLNAEELTELDERLAGRSTGDFLTEFSSAAAALSGGPDVAAELGAIADPEQRQLTESGLTVSLSKATNQRRSTARERIANAFDVIEKGGSLSDLSAEDKGNLTAGERNRLADLQLAIAKSGEPKTNFVTADNLVRLFETDIIAFAAVDLTDHRAQLGKNAFEQLSAWQELVRGDEDRADEEAIYIAALRAAADDHLRRADITPENLKGEDEKTAARFRTRLISDALAFREENGRLPYPEETAELADRLQPLMPSEGAGRDQSDEISLPENFDIRGSEAWKNLRKIYSDFYGDDEAKVTEGVERFINELADKAPEDLTPHDLVVIEQLINEFSSEPDSEEDTFHRFAVLPVGVDTITGDLSPAVPRWVRDAFMGTLDAVTDISGLLRDIDQGRYILPSGLENVIYDERGYVFVDGVMWGNSVHLEQEINARFFSGLGLYGGGGLVKSSASRPGANTLISVGGGGNRRRRVPVDLVRDWQKRKKYIEKAQEIIKQGKRWVENPKFEAQLRPARSKELDEIFAKVEQQAKFALSDGKVNRSVKATISWQEVQVLAKKWVPEVDEIVYEKDAVRIKSKEIDRIMYQFRAPAVKTNTLQSQTGIQINFEVFKRPFPTPEQIASNVNPSFVKISNVHIDVRP
ncbi:MAG: hypothetical protein ABJO38_02910 [Stappiaceae bacterium]